MYGHSVKLSSSKLYTSSVRSPYNDYVLDKRAVLLLDIKVMVSPAKTDFLTIFNLEM